jgi:hypothetical protein
MTYRERLLKLEDECATHLAKLNDNEQRSKLLSPSQIETTKARFEVMKIKTQFLLSECIISMLERKKL